jgi:hypothetical protein
MNSVTREKTSCPGLASAPLDDLLWEYHLHELSLSYRFDQAMFLVSE